MRYVGTGGRLPVRSGYKEGGAQPVASGTRPRDAHGANEPAHPRLTLAAERDDQLVTVARSRYARQAAVWWDSANPAPNRAIWASHAPATSDPPDAQNRRSGVFHGGLTCSRRALIGGIA